MAFVEPDFTEDPEAVVQEVLDSLADALPGWEPNPGTLDTALAEELAHEIAVLRSLTRIGLNLAVAGFGETAFGFPAYLGATADLPVEVTVTAAGVTIPAGLTVVGVNDNGDEVAFEVLDDVVATDTTMALTLSATDEGLAGNGVPAGSLTVVTATTDVVDVVATDVSANGADPEELEDYLTRLRDYLGTLRPGGVNAADMAALARSVPGVHRALAVDLYDPADPGTPAERTVTVFPIDEDNAPVSESVADQVLATLEAAREVNFQVFVAEPTYTAVDIAYTAVAESGADPEVVEASVTGAIAEWLAAFGSTTDDPQAWQPTTTLRRLELARVAGSASGVAYLAELTIDGAESDVELDGVAALPAALDDPTDPSTITGTVS